MPSLAFAYKNFAAFKGVSHIGLGVAGATTSAALQAASVVSTANVIPARHNIDIVRAVAEQQPTHLVISAPWISAYDLEAMVKHFPDTHFVVNSHSNVGFLQADPWGVRLLRQGLELSKRYPNLSIGGNSIRFVNWLQRAYGVPVVYLPNVYSAPGKVRARRWNPERGHIKIGCFGAVRPQKNVMTCAAAALLIRWNVGVPVTLYLSGGRHEGGGEVVRRAVQQMADGVPGFSVVDIPWRPWDRFKRLVGSMDLLLQVSYTESFNMVTADGAAQGVPSVVSNAIPWAPRSWRADADDAADIARVGERLLNSRFQSWLGVRALRRHNARAIRAWRKFLLP